MAAIMYEEYCLMQYSDEDVEAFKAETDSANVFSYYYIKLEVIAFYTYVGAAVIYLFCIQMRGIFGLDDDIKKKDRYKSDALEYYEKDIHWFAFSFSICASHFRSIYSAYDQYAFDHT